MTDESKRESAATRMRQINQAWLGGRVDDLAQWVHPEIVMVFPGFSGRCQGQEVFLAGFQDFCQNATTHEFHEHELQVDVAADTAVVTLRYEMVYERSAARYRATGRDLWVFQLSSGEWLAVWRTMLDLQESAV
jgi:ketosteroid isomerase-like protein